MRVFETDADERQLFPKLINCELSTFRLPTDTPNPRTPRRPNLPRSDEFMRNFDAHSVYFDCFWHKNDDVMLIGPAPTNHKKSYKKAEFYALPSRKKLSTKHHFSLSIMSSLLRNVPRCTTEIELVFDGIRETLKVQRSLADEFSGKNILFTLSKNNDLNWIRFWADYHVRHHGVNAVVIFDNGSSSYTTKEIESTLSTVQGLDAYTVISVPFPYGFKDEVLKTNPYWPQFLQMFCMSLVLRRFAPDANTIINMDIDELAFGNGESVCDLAKSSDMGLLSMKGKWVEAIPSEGEDFGDHRDYRTIRSDPKAAHCLAGKWVLDPSRKWVKNLRVFPYMHWIERRALLGRRYIDGVFFWHFRAINTNWKTNRAKVIPFDPALHERHSVDY